MQTFLPYPEFDKSAACLDMRRLGKQRVETLQILNSLAKERQSQEIGKGWYKHPARNMWRGYEESLIEYGLVICEEWIQRGYKDTCWNKIHEHKVTFNGKILTPPWIGNEAFHQSHRSSLLRKEPSYYRKFWPHEPDDIPYVWPVILK